MTESKKNDEPSPATANASEARKYKRGRPRSRKIKDEGAGDDSVPATQGRRAPESIAGAEVRETGAEEPAKPPTPAVAIDAVSTPEKIKPQPQSEAARPEPAAAPETQPSNGGPSHPGPGNQGEWQDRNFWRRNKRKRGRYGGSWQPGPGSGGGGSPHPQQP